MIGQNVLYFGNLHEKFGRDDHLAMLLSNVETRQKCLTFTCIQLAWTHGGPWTAYRCGNFSIPYFTNGFAISLFLQKHQDIPRFCAITNFEESLLYSLLFKEGAAKIRTMLWQDGLMPKTEVFLSHNKIRSKTRGGLSLGVPKTRWQRPCLVCHYTRQPGDQSA